MNILGIDIAKAKFDVTLLQDGKATNASFQNTKEGFERIGKWLKKQGVDKVHACMEATGNYGERLAIWLYEQGHTVSVVNPQAIHAYAKSQMTRNKTDKTDAALIARFCEREQPAVWTPKPPEIRALQALLTHLDGLKEERQRWANRLSSEPASSFVENSIRQHIAALDQDIEQVNKQIADHIDSHPSLKSDAELLRSIPGVGPALTAWFLSLQLRRFEHARAAAAFVGLSPKAHQSGSSVHRRESLSKMGNPKIRKSLYMPAMSAIRFNPIIATLAKRLSDKGKHARLIIGAAMHKLLVLAFGVLKSRSLFDQNFALTH
jgi:transposase